MVKSLTDAGMLSFPDSKLVYRVFHAQKRLILTNEDQLFVFYSYIVHVQTIWVFEAIGYKVLPDVREPEGYRKWVCPTWQDA